LDGIDGYVQAPYLLNPAEGPFSAACWAKGSALDKTILSQQDGTGTGRSWLKVEASGYLTTNLQSGGGGLTATGQLWNTTQWQHIGLVWDGYKRHLYINGLEVASDTTNLAGLESCDGLLYIGASKSLSSFWPGTIDDVGIWNRALSENEIWSIYRSGLEGQNLAHVTSYVIETDIVNDGRVDIKDFALLASCWLDNTCDKYDFNCQGADIFKDGSVDLADLRHLAADWLN